MSIKNLRVSGTTLLADVVVGANEYGSEVSVQLRLNRKDPAVAEALGPLTKLLADTGHKYLSESMGAALIQQQVRERTKVAVAAAQERIAKNARVELEQKVQTLERYLSAAQAEASRWRTRAEELDQMREAAIAQAQG